MPRCKQNGAVQHSDVVNRRLRPTFAGAGRDLRLPKPFKGATLAPRSLAIWRNVGLAGEHHVPPKSSVRSCGGHGGGRAITGCDRGLAG